MDSTISSMYTCKNLNKDYVFNPSYTIVSITEEPLYTRVVVRLFRLGYNTDKRRRHVMGKRWREKRDIPHENENG